MSTSRSRPNPCACARRSCSPTAARARTLCPKKPRQRNDYLGKNLGAPSFAPSFGAKGGIIVASQCVFIQENDNYKSPRLRAGSCPEPEFPRSRIGPKVLPSAAFQSLLCANDLRRDEEDQLLRRSR